MCQVAALPVTFEQYPERPFTLRNRCVTISLATNRQTSPVASMGEVDSWGGEMAAVNPGNPESGPRAHKGPIVVDPLDRVGANHLPQITTRQNGQNGHSPSPVAWSLTRAETTRRPGLAGDGYGDSEAPPASAGDDRAGCRHILPGDSADGSGAQPQSPGRPAEPTVEGTLRPAGRQGGADPGSHDADDNHKAEDWSHQTGEQNRHAAMRLMIVDDQGLFRKGLVRILTAETGFSVVAETGRNEAVRAARREQPDVTVFASDASAGRVAEEVTALLLAAPKSKIVVLAVHDEPRRVRHLLASGAHAYVLKSASPEELITTIRVVNEHADRVMLSVSRQTLNTLRGNQGLLLSERELEVLTLVAEGNRNCDIAAQLYIAEGTVKRHLTNIYAKLGAISRTDAVRKAVTQGHGLYTAPSATTTEARNTW